MNAFDRILVVDDEPDVCETVKSALTTEGYRVRAASSASAARRQLKELVFDLMILDLGLPDGRGLDLAREVQAGYDCAIIILTGKAGAVDRVIGLEMGADDYISKPFDPRELVARVRSVLRRVGRAHPASEASEVQFLDWRLNYPARRLTTGSGAETPLTTGEFNLLRAFISHPNQVLSRDQLLDLAHGRKAGPFDRSIDVQVGRLRRKIETDVAQPQLIKTIRGAGYMFVAPVERLEASKRRQS